MTQKEFDCLYKQIKEKEKLTETSITDVSKILDEKIEKAVDELKNVLFTLLQTIRDCSMESVKVEVLNFVIEICLDYNPTDSFCEIQYRYENIKGYLISVTFDKKNLTDVKGKIKQNIREYLEYSSEYFIILADFIAKLDEVQSKIRENIINHLQAELNSKERKLKKLRLKLNKE